jgi:ATP-binding cassette subfamily B protein
MYLPTTIFSLITPFVKKQWMQFSVLTVAAIFWMLGGVVFPYFLKNIVNSLQGFSGDRSFVYTKIGLALGELIGFWVLGECFVRIQGVMQLYTFPCFKAAIREKIISYTMRHSHDFFCNALSGDLANKINTISNCCEKLVSIVLFQFTTMAIGVSLTLIMMWNVNQFFAVILLICMAIHLIIILLFLNKAKQLWENHAESSSLFNGKIVDMLTNMFSIRLFSRCFFEENYLKYFQQDEINKGRKAGWLSEIMRIFLGLNGIFLIVGMMFFLVNGWVHYYVTLGDFTQVLMQSFWFLSQLWSLGDQLASFSSEKAVLKNALNLIGSDHTVPDKPNAYSFKVNKGIICYKNVKFSYHAGMPIFNKLNVCIAEGQKVGLVGFSGAGKSTFVNLLLRFYDLELGQIMIDGQDISKISQLSLRDQISVIPQDSSLFHRSFMENIRYGRLDATDEEVIEASKQAHCHDFIQQQSEGYAGLVGERGVKLSGGERQRIAIARAILKNAPILILDEATSALDSVTEKKVQSALGYVMRGKTTLVIAHRLSTLANMDRILVFHQGEIIEDGTKEQLLKQNGHFSKLWKMQIDGFIISGGKDSVANKVNGY